MESSVKADSTDALGRQRRQFEEFCENTQASRALSEKCRDYYDGKQWTEAEQKVLEKRKQPCITDNKIRDKVDTLLGMEEEMRTAPKAYPRTEHEEESAEAATDALRFVAESCQYQRTCRAPQADNLAVEGLAYGLVVVERPKGCKYPKISIEHVRWDRGYYDVHALRPDFDDKSYCGYFTWMDVTKVQRKWEKSADAIEGSFGDSVASEKSHEDKPRYAITSGNRRRVQVFTHYECIDDKWHQSIWIKGGYLEEPKPCEYKDEFGEPTCPMEIQAVYRDSEGDPYGMVQRYLDLQDEHNKRRSKMLHLLNAKRMIAQKGAISDPNAARAELHKPDGFIELDGDIAQFKVEDNLSEAEGQWRLQQQTEAALASTGPNAALTGQSGDLSGRAKQLDQRAGAILVNKFFQAIELLELRLYRQAWCRVRQYWKSEMWIRVTDNDNVKFSPLNKPETVGERQARQIGKQNMPQEEKAAQVQQIAADPAMQEQTIRNNVAEMDVDIIIDRSPDVVNIQAEQFEVLSKLAEQRPQEVPFAVVVEASSLRSETKKKMLDKLSGNDPASQQMAQLQQQMQQLGMALQAANVAKTQAQAEQASAAAAESHIDAAVKVATFTSPDPNNPDGKPAGKTQVSVN